MQKNKNLMILNYGEEDFNKPSEREIEIKKETEKDTSVSEGKIKIKIKKNSKDNKVFDGQFITAIICYYIEFKCPNCGRFNLHRHKNIFDCVGPDWASKPVKCKDCSMEFYVQEDYGKLYKDI